ncbi:hypothetical protein AKJ16_DCAP00253 [Drosera capensis]
MAATSRRRTSGPVLRSLSPSGRFAGGSFSSASSAASAFASSTSTFTSRSSTFFHRSASPTRVTMTSSSPSSSSSVRFSIIDRSISPSRSIASTGATSQATVSQKRTCMCSPTTHPGSFRCSLHKKYGGSPSRRAVPYQSNGLYARRSAMTNSLVRIGTVEGDLVKRALAALIRPSSHQQRRRSAFQPRPSRLSIMSSASDVQFSSVNFSVIVVSITMWFGLPSYVIVVFCVPFSFSVWEPKVKGNPMDIKRTLSINK